MIPRLTILALATALAASACSDRTTSRTNDSADDPIDCAQGTAFLVPGCGDPALPEAGCYTSCDEDNPCPDGLACATFVIDPCAGQLCEACGAEASVCVEPNGCRKDETFLVPGCGEPALPDAGCYTSCDDDTACPDGFSCKSFVTDPCAGQLCEACGAQTSVCVDDDGCSVGEAFFAPGCGEPALPEAGCYRPCDEETACAPGLVCTEVVTNPCAGSLCEACGATRSLCLAPAATN